MNFKNVIFVTGLLLSSLSLAAKPRWVPFKCGFDVPHMTPEYKIGIYEAFGATVEEAKARDLASCKKDFESKFPGKCDAEAKKPIRWACNWTPRWEF